VYTSDPFTPPPGTRAGVVLMLALIALIVLAISLMDRDLLIFGKKE
jgi:hypothetical protein